jgi:hypothetical protein
MMKEEKSRSVLAPEARAEAKPAEAPAQASA